MKIIIKSNIVFTFLFSLILFFIVNYFSGLGIQLFLTTLVSAILLLCIYLCLLLHEFSHAVVLWSANIPIKAITLQWDRATIETVTKEEDVPLRIKFLSSIVAPMSNIVAGLLLMLAVAISNDSIVELFLLFFSICHLFTGLFNLLPIAPLDGYRALKFAILLVNGSKK